MKGRGQLRLPSSERKDVRPLLIKLGLGLALSFAGFLVSQLPLWPRRRGRLPGPSAAGGGTEIGSKRVVAANGGLKDEIFTSGSEDEQANVFNATSMASATMMNLFPNLNNSQDDVGFLLPEFNELVLKEFEASKRDPEKNPDVHSFVGLENKDYDALEQEITELRNLLNDYKERERDLETQLIEYYGLKEQENVVKEFENRVKISTVEAQLLSVKIESLQDENKKLQDQLSEYSTAMTELKAANEEIKLLKRKLKSDAELTKEKIAELLKRVSMLQERELANANEHSKVEGRLKDLENEIADLRRKNSQLVQEKSDLVKKFELSQMLASSNLISQQAEALQEANHMRELNDKLKKDIEQLQTDRCADVEELVYLKWINACLRYELRNYQSFQGKTIARDLSNCLSPKSEEKAKRLILEYATAGTLYEVTGIPEFDSDCCSSSQASTGEADDNSIDMSSTTKTSHSSRSKLFSKLKKLVLGKERHHSSCGDSEMRGSLSTCSVDDLLRRDSYESMSSGITVEHSEGSLLAWMESNSDEHPQKKAILSSLDHSSLIRVDPENKRSLKERCKSDIGPAGVYSRKITAGYSLIDSDRKSLLGLEGNIDIPEKAKLKKLAKALRSSYAKAKPKRRTTSTQF